MLGNIDKSSINNGNSLLTQIKHRSFNKMLHYDDYCDCAVGCECWIVL